MSDIVKVNPGQQEKKLTDRAKSKKNVIEQNKDLVDLLMVICGGICCRPLYIELCNRLSIRKYTRYKNGIKKRGPEAKKSCLDEINLVLSQLRKAELIDEIRYGNKYFLVAKKFLYQEYKVPPLFLKRDDVFDKSILLTQYILNTYSKNDYPRLLAFIKNGTSLTHRKTKSCNVAQSINIDQSSIDALTARDFYISRVNGFNEFNALTNRLYAYHNEIKSANLNAVDTAAARKMVNEKYSDIMPWAVDTKVVDLEHDTRKINLVLVDARTDFDRDYIKYRVDEIVKILRPDKLIGIYPALYIEVITYNKELVRFQISDDKNRVFVSCRSYEDPTIKTSKEGKAKEAIIARIVQSDDVYVRKIKATNGEMVLIDD